MRRREGNRLAAQLAIGAVLVLLASVIGIGIVVSKRVPIDADTMCPSTAQIPRTTMFLIDRHPQLVQDPASLVRVAIEARSIEFVRFERVVVRALDKGGIVGPPLYEKCHPGRAADAVELVETASKMERRYRDEFIAPMLAALRDAPRRAASDAPLIEVLSDISHRRELHFRSSVGQRLIVLSPWLQASPGLTQLQQCESSYNTYLRGEFSQRYPVNLKNVALLPYLIAVDGADRGLQRVGLRKFWEGLLGTPMRGDSAVSEPIRPPAACYYPTLEDEANRYLKLARGAMEACRVGEARTLVKTAEDFSARVVASAGAGAALRRHKERCDELARLRAEELAAQSRAGSAPGGLR